MLSWASEEDYRAYGVIRAHACLIGSNGTPSIVAINLAMLSPLLAEANPTSLDVVGIVMGVLGGLALFGPLGFVLGPVVAALFVTIWELYGHAFRDVLPPVERAESD